MKTSSWSIFREQLQSISLLLLLLGLFLVSQVDMRSSRLTFARETLQTGSRLVTRDGEQVRQMISPVPGKPIVFGIPVASKATRLLIDVDSCALPHLRPTVELLDVNAQLLKRLVLTCKFSNDRPVEYSPGQLPILEAITLSLSDYPRPVHAMALRFPDRTHSHPRMVSVSHEIPRFTTDAQAVWVGLRKQQKEVFCDACILGSAAVTSSEAIKLLEFQWKILAPEGEKGKDFIERYLLEENATYAKAMRDERRMYSNRKRLGAGKALTLVASRVPFTANLLYLPSLWNTAVPTVHPLLPITIQRALNEPPTPMSLQPGVAQRLELRGGEIIRVKSSVKAELLFEEEGDNKPLFSPNASVRKRMQVAPDLRVVRRTLKMWPVVANSEWGFNLNTPTSGKVALRLDMAQVPSEALLNPGLGSLQALLSDEENEEDDSGDPEKAREEKVNLEDPVEFVRRRPVPVPLFVRSLHADGSIATRRVECAYDPSPEAVYSVFGSERKRLPVTYCKPVYWESESNIVRVTFSAQSDDAVNDQGSKPLIAVRLANLSSPSEEHLPKLIGSHLDAWRWLIPQRSKRESIDEQGITEGDPVKPLPALFVFRKPLVDEFAERGMPIAQELGSKEVLNQTRTESLQPSEFVPAQSVFRALTRSIQGSSDDLLSDTDGVQITADRWVEVDLPATLETPLPSDTLIFLPRIGSYRAEIHTGLGQILPVPGSRFTELGTLLPDEQAKVKRFEGEGSLYARISAGIRIPKTSGWRSTQKESVYALNPSLTFAMKKASNGAERVRVWLYADPSSELQPVLSMILKEREGSALRHSSEVVKSWTIEGFKTPFTDMPAVASAVCALSDCSNDYTVKSVSLKLGEDIKAGDYSLTVNSDIPNVVYARVVHEYAVD